MISENIYSTLDTMVSVNFHMLIYCRKGEKLRSKHRLRRGNKDNLELIFLFLSENICCDPSLEPSQRYAFNEGYSVRFHGKIRIIIP